MKNKYKKYELRKGSVLVNKLELEFNKRRSGFPAVECSILDLVNGGGFVAKLNAISISDVVRNLPDGYEIDVLDTLKNYYVFYKDIEKYSIELKNSQYIYYERFDKLIYSGLYEYIKALENNDIKLMSKLDRLYGSDN